MSKRFLFVIVEAGGNVPVQLSIARRLVARGHTVRVLGDPALADDARAAGCEHQAFRTAPHNNFRPKTAETIADAALTKPLDMLRNIGDRIMFAPAERYARDLLAEVEAFHPDVLAIDFLPLGALIGAEKSGLPTALLQHTILTRPLPGIPAPGFGTVPSRSWLARVRDRLLWRVSCMILDKIGRAAINDARRSIGLVPVAHVLDQMSRATRTLVLASRTFDDAATLLPDDVRYVGPELEDPPWATAWQSPWPEDHPQPLVLASLGSTYQGQEEPLRRVIEALGLLPARGLVTLADLFEPLPAPPNVSQVRSAPHQHVLPHARAVVSHAGHGTVMKALAAGVPLVCIPLGRDQKDVAARVVASGAGLALKRDASVAQIQRAVARVLEEPRFADNARRLRDAIAHETASDAAVAELEDLARAAAAAPRLVA